MLSKTAASLQRGDILQVEYSCRFGNYAFLQGDRFEVESVYENSFRIGTCGDQPRDWFVVQNPGKVECMDYAVALPCRVRKRMHWFELFKKVKVKNGK